MNLLETLKENIATALSETKAYNLPALCTELGLAEGDRVDLVSEFPGEDGLEERRAKDFLVVPYPTPPGNAAAYYPETNPLVPLDHVAAKSNTPVSKAVIIRLESAG